MDIDLYEKKIEEVLSKGNYKLLAKDPTASIERKVYQTLRKYQNYFSDRERSTLTPHHSKPPHLYGLPKIHKAEVPLRPITSTRDSATYNLAKFLLPIIQPLQGNTPTFVKNSRHFVEILGNINVMPEDQLVSFDVESLYTNVPVQDSLQVIREKLQEDEALKNRTSLPVTGIMELLECCLRNCYFQEKDRFFAQEDGLPMGSSLSPVIANIYMEWFEAFAIDKADKKPRMWLRYVDDTFVIWNHGDDELETFLRLLNEIRPSINFTMEKETQEGLPFLDVKVQRTNDKFQTSVYRKPTHTGQYLNFESNHHGATKRGIVRSLVDRAYSLCNTDVSLTNELNNIKTDLRRNGYSDKHIASVLNRRRDKTEKSDGPTQPTLCLPYVRGLSDNIRRIGSRYNIRTCFRSSNTIRSQLTKTRPPNENSDSKNCIYRVPCECGMDYVGETKRPLNVRIGEHKKNTQRGETSKSGIADHVWTNQHSIAWSEAEVIHKEQHWYKRKLIESAYILNNDVFSQPSIEIRNVWKPLLTQLDKLKFQQRQD